MPEKEVRCRRHKERVCEPLWGRPCGKASLFREAPRNEAPRGMRARRLEDRGCSGQPTSKVTDHATAAGYFRGLNLVDPPHQHKLDPAGMWSLFGSLRARPLWLSRTWTPCTLSPHAPAACAVQAVAWDPRSKVYTKHPSIGPCLRLGVEACVSHPIERYNPICSGLLLPETYLAHFSG